MPLNIDWQQILLHWMNLAILICGLYFLLYKPVKKFMAKREEYYRDMENQTAGKLAEAEELKAACQAKLDAADEEIRQARLRAQQSSEQAAEAELAQARTEARQIIAKAQAEAEQSREQAILRSQLELKELAAAAARKLAAKPGTDPFDQFLHMTEGGDSHEGQ